MKTEGGTADNDGTDGNDNSGSKRQGTGMTYSKGGVPLSRNGKGNRRRRNYPLSWGSAPDKMRMKKRVLCVFDGPRRLWKDDMMLEADHEVRIPLPGYSEGRDRRWITDLDVQTIKRALGLHNATDEEKGPALDENGNNVDIEQLMMNGSASTMT